MVALAVSVFALASCDSVGLDDYDDLTGQYSGRTNSQAGETLELVAVATVDVVTQIDGDLVGTLGVSGLMSGVLFSTDQTFSGTVGKGMNPPVSLRLDTGCGVYTELSGDYDAAARQLLLSGEVGIPGYQCLGATPVLVNVVVTKEPGS